MSGSPTLIFVGVFSSSLISLLALAALLLSRRRRPMRTLAGAPGASWLFVAESCSFGIIWEAAAPKGALLETLTVGEASSTPGLSTDIGDDPVVMVTSGGRVPA